MLAISPHSHKVVATAPGIMSSYNHLQGKLGWEVSLHTFLFNSGRKKKSTEVQGSDVPLFLTSQIIVYVLIGL